MRARPTRRPILVDALLAAEHKRDGKLNKTRMAKALDEYERLWREWRQLKQDHPSCPTLYKESQHGAWGAPPAMDVTVREYRQALRP